MGALFEKYTQFSSEEVVVRDVLVAYVQREFGIAVARTSFVWRNGVVCVRTTPLIKQQLLLQESALIKLLASRGVQVSRLF